MAKTLVEQGGGAFPPGHLGAEGMSLRDFFAAHALTGLFAAFDSSATSSFNAGDATFASAAKSAYRLADEMLKARGR